MPKIKSKRLLGKALLKFGILLVVLAVGTAIDLYHIHAVDITKQKQQTLILTTKSPSIPSAVKPVAQPITASSIVALLNQLKQ